MTKEFSPAAVGTSQRHAPRRRGISLMEVLFSVGVISIGLLGVAILIPVSGKLQREGTMADRAARDGQNWFREIKIRGFTIPTNWVNGTNASTYPVYFDASPTGTSGVTYVNSPGTGSPPTPGTGGPMSTGYVKQPPVNGITYQPWETSYCIDPRYVAAQNGTVTNFPDLDTVSPAPTYPMQRVSLRANCLAVASSNTSFAMSQQLADDTFFSQDDLTFTIPVDAHQSPIQIMMQDGGGTNVKRRSDGELSWFFTMVPVVEGAKFMRDTYLASIVVVQNRVLTRPIAPANAQTGYVDQERYATVTNFWGSGITGGDLRIQSVRYRAEDLTLKRGDWVLLTAQLPVFDVTGASSPFVNSRWYRVLSSGDPPVDTGNAYQRDVTLLGPDWDVIQSQGPALPTTQVTLVSGVVAVFEKTIRLETSSLWAN